MRVDVLTIFPEVFPGPLGIGVINRALETGAIELHVHDLRDHSIGKHRQVDDMQFGGNAGMVMKPEPIIRAVRALRADHPGIRSILMSPRGRRFTQDVAYELASEQSLLLVCGRYQGVDERAVEEVGEELSVGDFVLSGGEVAAMAIIESVARLIPGVLGSPESLSGETFAPDAVAGVEPPLYTRPAVFEGKEVPFVLRNGNHAEIEKWRHQQSEERGGQADGDTGRLNLSFADTARTAGHAPAIPATGDPV